MGQSLLVDAVTAAGLLGVSERTFHALRRRPDFPRPVENLGPRMVRWRRAEIEQWVAGLPSASAQGEPPQLRGARQARTASWPPPPPNVTAGESRE